MRSLGRRLADPGAERGGVGHVDCASLGSDAILRERRDGLVDGPAVARVERQIAALVSK
jgi:hypothetical protein